MAVKVLGEGEVLRAVSQVLVEHLRPAMVVRFWASWQTGHSSYLRWRDEYFQHETVAPLYEKVKAFQEAAAPDPNSE